MMKRFGIIAFLFCIGLGSSFAQQTVQIPNIITPNNDDVNDIFSIRTTGFEKLTCTIINRNGEIMYRYYGLNGTWDGYTFAGVKVSAGVYFVYAELTDESGNTETRQGTLQVVY